MQELHWDGITKSATLTAAAIHKRHAVINAAKNQQWNRLLAIVNGDRQLVNVTRPDGKAFYAPLHHAAYAGAPEAIVHDLLQLNAFRSLRDANGDRPVDIASKRLHTELIHLLDPRPARYIRPEALSAIQDHFHEVIRGRVNPLVLEHHLRLPQLEIVLEFASAKFWFDVPEMYGGFAFWLRQEEPEPKLAVESWCRVVRGSGQRHEIAQDGPRLIDDGFV